MIPVLAPINGKPTTRKIAVSRMHRCLSRWYGAGLLVLLGACSSTPQEPLWVTQASTLYPGQKYLSATGEGGDQSSADARALANLARIFEVAIVDSSLDFAESRSAGGDSDSRRQASRSISTDTSQVLQGAKIAEHWQAANGSAYSLAILEKEPAARRLRKSVQQADQQTLDLLHYASVLAPNPVAALSALEQSRRVQLQRDSVNRSLAIVTGTGINSPINAADIEAMIRRNLATLEFAAVATEPEMRGALQAAIASLGIQYRPDSSYQLWGNLDAGPAQRLQGWHWLRGSMQLGLRNNANVLANMRWPIKLSAVDESQLQQRARDQLNNEIGSQLYQLLVSAGDNFRQQHE
jgi:hypothetical protein